MLVVLMAGKWDILMAVNWAAMKAALLVVSMVEPWVVRLAALLVG